MKDLESRLSPSQLKHVISGYLQLGRISKNIVKHFEKVGISVEVLDALGEICQGQLDDDPHALKNTSSHSISTISQKWKEQLSSMNQTKPIMYRRNQWYYVHNIRLEGDWKALKVQ